MQALTCPLAVPAKPTRAYGEMAEVPRNARFSGRGNARSAAAPPCHSAMATSTRNASGAAVRLQTALAARGAGMKEAVTTPSEIG